MPPKIHKYQDLLEQKQASRSKVHLLVGSGFSAGASSAMTARGLEREMELVPGFEEVRPLFVSAGSWSFEQVMSHVLFTSAVEDGPEVTEGKLRNLQQFFGRCVASAQLYGTDGSDIAKMGCASEFLAPFSTISSLNFDIFVYRALLRGQEDELYAFTDGFGPTRDDTLNVFHFTGFKQWSTRVRLFHLHGSVFIREDPARRAEKVTKDSIGFLSEQEMELFRSQGAPSLSAIALLGYDRIRPLVVASGSDAEKLQQINRSHYLRDVNGRFRETSGALFTYGWSLSSHDHHILQAITSNHKLAHLCVGLYGDPLSTENVRIIETARRLPSDRSDRKRPLEVQFFSSSSAGVWEEPDLTFVANATSASARESNIGRIAANRFGARRAPRPAPATSRQDLPFQ